MRSVALGLMVNAALAVIKGVAGLLGHSHALIADATESLLDIFQGVVVLGGLHIASTEPDDCHPYGHGKAEPLAAIVISIGLFGAGIGIAIESLRQIFGDDNRTPEVWTLAVIIGVIVTKELMFRHMGKVAKAIHSTAVKADAWHHRSDALTSAAAFVGILIAVIGGEGYEAADDWAALLACAIICFNGYLLFRPSLAEVMDAAPSEAIRDEVCHIADSVHGVSGLHVCIVRKMGFDFYVDLHVRVDRAYATCSSTSSLTTCPAP
jgi:cation diffusion facilitator family transporter